MKLPFNPRNKKTQVLVGIFLAALVASLTFCSQKAEAGDLSLELGSAVVRGETPALGFSANFTDAGPGATDLEVGILLIGESVHREVDQSNTGTIYGVMWSNLGPKFQLGIGIAHTQGTQTYTCDNTFALGARWRLSERTAVQWRHFSSADTCQPNTGRDLITFTVRLGR